MVGARHRGIASRLFSSRRRFRLSHRTIRPGPITLIVPFAPGGPAECIGRLIGLEMCKEFGQQVVVDNRPGANTIMGAQAVARASPDGYTLLLAIDGTLVMNPFLYANLELRSIQGLRAGLAGRGRTLGT